MLEMAANDPTETPAAEIPLFFGLKLNTLNPFSSIESLSPQIQFSFSDGSVRSVRTQRILSTEGFSGEVVTRWPTAL